MKQSSHLGFCGSLTTFSSWQLDVFFAWAGAPAGLSHWHIVSAIILILSVFQCPITVLGWLQSPYLHPNYIHGISRLRVLAHYDGATYFYPLSWPAYAGPRIGNILDTIYSHILRIRHRSTAPARRHPWTYGILSLRDMDTPLSWCST